MPTKRTTSAKKSLSIAKLRPVVLRVAREHGARNVRIFGSFARGEQRKTSDVDLLVTMPKESSLLDLAGLKVDLEEALKRRVDVIPDDSIKPILRDRILSEARTL